MNDEWRMETCNFFSGKPRVILKALIVTGITDKGVATSFSDHITWLTADMNMGLWLPVFTTLGGIYQLPRFLNNFYQLPRFLNNCLTDDRIIEFVSYHTDNNIMWRCEHGWAFDSSRGYAILFDQQCFEMSKTHSDCEQNIHIQRLVSELLLPPLSKLILSFLIIAIPTLDN
jgi:hypothetical protein